MPGLIAVVLAVMVAQGPVTVAGTFNSFVDGRKYSSIVSRQDAESSPRWLTSEEQPPLSPRRAMDSATTLLLQLFEDGAAWSVRRVTLNQIWGPDIWIYIVECSRPPREVSSGVGGVGGGPLTNFSAVILMSGRAVQPQVVLQ